MDWIALAVWPDQINYNKKYLLLNSMNHNRWILSGKPPEKCWNSHFCSAFVENQDLYDKNAKSTTVLSLSFRPVELSF